MKPGENSSFRYIKQQGVIINLAEKRNFRGKEGVRREEKILSGKIKKKRDFSFKGKN